MEGFVWHFFFFLPSLVNNSGENVKKYIQQNDPAEENVSLLEKHSCLQEKSKIKFSNTLT